MQTLHIMLHESTWRKKAMLHVIMQFDAELKHSLEVAERGIVKKEQECTCSSFSSCAWALC